MFNSYDPQLQEAETSPFDDLSEEGKAIVRQEYEDLYDNYHYDGHDDLDEEQYRIIYCNQCLSMEEVRRQRIETEAQDSLSTLKKAGFAYGAAFNRAIAGIWPTNHGKAERVAQHYQGRKAAIALHAMARHIELSEDVPYKAAMVCAKEIIENKAAKELGIIRI